MTSYLGVHRQQLFHWIGGHIDVKTPPGDKLNDSQRVEYIECLRNALKPNEGLWAKIPRDPDCLGDGNLISVRRPITCFTEWSLTQSVPHTSRYGHLGLGFSKQFVLDRGGQPVAYVRDRENSPYIRALLNLAKWFENDSGRFGIPSAMLKDLKEDLEFITHFNKSIQKAVPAKKTPAPKGASATTIKKAKAARVFDPYSRRVGRFLHFLEEREWRIVYDKSLAKYYNNPVKRSTSGPAYYLKFSPGKHLSTVVLPDNATLNLAIRDKNIREALYPVDSPHVTLLSFQDIGTF